MKLEDYPLLAKGLWWALLMFLAAQLYTVTLLPAWDAWTLGRFVPQNCVLMSKDIVEARGGSSLAGRGYSARVRYRLASGNGQTFSAISPFRTSGGWNEQKARIDSLPEAGQPVTCFVDPENSASAYLSTKIEWLGVLLSLIPVFFCGLTFLLWRTWRRLDEGQVPS